MSETSFDIITKSALWTSYNNIYFYCSRPIDWDDLHIDHIIPEYFSNQLEKFEQIKIDYGLNSDFVLNALYNLVPTHGKCNLRKGSTLFSKETTLYYLALTNRTLEKIKAEIQKLKNRKNKGQILSRLQLALETQLIDIKELESIFIKAKQENWENEEIKLPDGVEFIDEVYDSFYLQTDCSKLYDKKLLMWGEYDSLELSNDNHETIVVSTLREWQSAQKSGFYPSSTIAIKMSDSFTFLEGFLEALHNAKMPRTSFISEPWIELRDLEYLSPNIIHDFEGELSQYAKEGTSIADLVKKGIITVTESSVNKISLEYEGMETSLIEQFRADFNKDGLEDIFVRGWTRAIGGTLGYGFTTILTRYSAKNLIEEVK